MSRHRDTLTFQADIIPWRGPAPFVFAALPPEDAETLRTAAKAASYGWGAVPVEAAIGETRFTTSLFPREGTYYLPLRDAVRKTADIAVGDRITITLRVAPRH